MAGFTSLIPIILLFAFVGVFAWVAYQMYLYSQQLGNRGQAYMEKHNISYSKDGGVRVGVKEMTNEQYSDKTQSYFVKTWNASQWPDYKSRFWNKDTQGKAKSSSSGPSPTPRPAASRHSSSNKAQ